MRAILSGRGDARPGPGTAVDAVSALRVQNVRTGTSSQAPVCQAAAVRWGEHAPLVPIGGTKLNAPGGRRDDATRRQVSVHG